MQFSGKKLSNNTLARPPPLAVPPPPPGIGKILDPPLMVACGK